MVPNSYIPAATRCVLRGKDDAAAWFDTRKEVDASKAVAAQCPITDRRVLSVELNGYALFFPPEVVRTRRPNIPAMSILNYDVSDDATRTRAADVLRRRAVRTTFSGWVVPTDKIPWALVDELRAAGEVVTLYRYDPADAESLLFAIQHTLRTQIRQAGESAEASADRAAQQYAESDKPNRGKYLEQRIKAAHADAQKKLTAYQEAAVTFGINPADLEVTTATAVANAIQVGVFVRAERFVAAVAALRAQNTAAATAMADAAEAGDAPTGVMADMIQDAGTAEAEAVAVGLRDAFDDGIFDLTAADDAA